eukprot:9670242-Heterocapsa_arctica.AAC.1
MRPRGGVGVNPKYSVRPLQYRHSECVHLRSSFGRVERQRSPAPCAPASRVHAGGRPLTYGSDPVAQEKSSRESEGRDETDGLGEPERERRERERERERKRAHSIQGAPQSVRAPMGSEESPLP